MKMAKPDRSDSEALRQAGLCIQRGEWLSAEGMLRYLLEGNPTKCRAPSLTTQRLHTTAAWC